MNPSRIALAKEILVASQTASSCPFLAAVPVETRAELEVQIPNPEALSAAQLLEIAALHQVIIQPSQLEHHQDTNHESTS